ncbi:MAG: bifunctional 5,10-methylenetetrahydrofolate dehydrogenase/5,10-methenyltetrahydrofolate cyclohydrolase [Rhizobiaceae bacterium]
MPEAAKQTMTAAVRDHRLIDGKAVQTRILAEVRAKVDAFVTTRPVGRLVSIMVGGSPEVQVYVRNQERGANRAGIPFEQQLWPADITQDECKRRIQALNDSAEVLGIILQRPVPAHINVRSLQSAIHPLKDVEGMNPASIGNIVYSDIALAPCTAAASVELLKETGLQLKGLEVVMIGHSEIVGKPIALMLMAEGATVTVCHHMSRSVAMHSRRADAVVVAVGKAHLIGPDMIKPGAAVIDIGINQVTDADGTARIVGDVDTDAVLEVAGWLTPVPGGVGPVTVAMLMRNSIVAHQRQIAAGWMAG